MKGSDYTVSDNSVTISKAYLTQQGADNTKLTFLFSGGKIPSVNFNVSDSGGGPVTASSLEIQKYNDSASSSSNQISPRIRVINKGKKALTLSGVTIRYYYTSDGTQPQSFFSDWSTVGRENVTGTFNQLTNPTDTADSFWKLALPARQEVWHREAISISPQDSLKTTGAPIVRQTIIPLTPTVKPLRIGTK